MNNSLTKELSNHLQSNSYNAIRVRTNTLRLKKKSGLPRFAFTLKDIEQQFESVDNLLVKLPVNGFTSNVQFTLIKMYTNDEGKISYKTFKTITENLTENEMKTIPTQTTQYQGTVPTPQYGTPPNSPYGMGYLGAPEMISKLVEAERGKDFKKTSEELEEKLKTANSENRILREQNNSLEIKIATIKERSEIERERDKLDKKGFLDSEGGTKVIDFLGLVMPKALEALTPKNVPPIPQALGTAQIEISTVKKMVVEKIKSQNFSDEQTGVLNYILDNWNKNLVENIVELINKKEQKNGH